MPIISFNFCTSCRFRQPLCVGFHTTPPPSLLLCFVSIFMCRQYRRFWILLNVSRRACVSRPSINYMSQIAFFGEKNPFLLKIIDSFFFLQTKSQFVASWYSGKFKTLIFFSNSYFNEALYSLLENFVQTKKFKFCSALNFVSLMKCFNVISECYVFLTVKTILTFIFDGCNKL